MRMHRARDRRHNALLSNSQDIRERLSVLIADQKTGIQFLDGPGRREAAGRGHFARALPKASRA